MSARIEAIKTEIINRVKAIEAQKAEKADVIKSYNDTIKALEAEKRNLLLELEDAYRAELVETADELLDAPSNQELNLVD